MSNIYIQEPPTSGKVLLSTTVGDIDIELWSKEAPKACRNFVQLCMEGYYNGTIFHRVIKDFIIQGGDPTGTGHGGESIWGKTFKDEIHSRLRFSRRGLVAMANAGQHDNGSQFFFTLGPAPELNNKHTIFAKVGGNTIYNMIKMVDCEIGEGDRPVYPHKIIKTKLFISWVICMAYFLFEVLATPFDDIIPRNLSSKKDRGDEPRKKKSTAKATKNFKLLSFGEEAEEDEEEVDKASQSMRGKSKSSHDLLNDDKLSALPAVVNRKRKSHAEEEVQLQTPVLEEEQSEEKEEMRENISKKLKKKERDKNVTSDENKPSEEEKEKGTPEKEKPPAAGSVDVMKEIDDEKQRLKASRMEDLKIEQEKLKREIARHKKLEDVEMTEEAVVPEADEDAPGDNDVISQYKAERRKFKESRKKQKPKTGSREQQTLALLEKFKSKLNSAKMLQEYAEGEEGEEKEGKKEEEEEEEEEEDESNPSISWLGHKLEFDSKNAKVLDANIDDVDRYEIYDPRNPMNKRRREASKQSMKKK